MPWSAEGPLVPGKVAWKVSAGHRAAAVSTPRPGPLSINSPSPPPTNPLPAPPYTSVLLSSQKQLSVVQVHWRVAPETVRRGADLQMRLPQHLARYSLPGLSPSEVGVVTPAFLLAQPCVLVKGTFSVILGCYFPGFVNKSGPKAFCHLVKGLLRGCRRWEWAPP